MTIEVIKPGLATTVQDLGRPGYYHLGIPLSGAHRPVRPAPGQPAGRQRRGRRRARVHPAWPPSSLFNGDTVFAVTGAAARHRSVNGQPRRHGRAIAVAAGDGLSFGFMKSGARAYVAVAGGIDVPVVLGSRSTYGLGALGGFQGRKVSAGDVLPVGQPARAARAGRGRETPRCA